MTKRRGRHRRGIGSSPRWTCTVCKRRGAMEFYRAEHQDDVIDLLIDAVCGPCGEWIAPRLRVAVHAIAKDLITQVREVRKLERLVSVEDA
jgi:hypothetical protein